jgi:hypothetical protein
MARRLILNKLSPICGQSASRLNCRHEETKAAGASEAQWSVGRFAIDPVHDPDVDEAGLV